MSSSFSFIFIVTPSGLHGREAFLLLAGAAKQRHLGSGGIVDFTSRKLTIYRFLDIGSYAEG